MSDHNPSDSFDSHPENAGYSNDDFEQVDAPSSGYYYHDDIGGDADGPDAVGPGAYYDYDPEQNAEISTTTANVGEEEAEEDRYAAGASEAEAYGTHTHTSEPLVALADAEDENSFDTHSVQPSAPVPDSESAIDFASYSGEDILAAVAPVASPPSSSHYTESTLSTKYDENEFHDSKGKKTVKFPERKATGPYFYDEPIPIPGYFADSVSSCSSYGSPCETDTAEGENTREAKETATGSFLKCVDPRVKDLIYWRDVKKTGAIFGTMLVVLLSLAVFSILSVLAYMSLAILTVTFIFVIYKKILSSLQKSNDGHPFKSLLEKDIRLDEVKLKSFIRSSLSNVNAALKELRHLFLVEDVVDSVKFGILLWSLTYIGSWFNDLTLIVLALILVFTVPKLYETYQVQIDNYIALAKAQINRYLSIIESKIPFLKKKEKAN